MDSSGIQVSSFGEGEHWREARREEAKKKKEEEERRKKMEQNSYLHHSWNSTRTSEALLMLDHKVLWPPVSVPAGQRSAPPPIWGRTHFIWTHVRDSPEWKISEKISSQNQSWGLRSFWTCSLVQNIQEPSAHLDHQ